MAFPEEFSNGPLYLAHYIAIVLAICYNVAFVHDQVRLAEFDPVHDFHIVRLVLVGIIIQSPVVYVVLFTLLAFQFLIAKGTYYYLNGWEIPGE